MNIGWSSEGESVVLAALDEPTHIPGGGGRVTAVRYYVFSKQWHTDREHGRRVRTAERHIPDHVREEMLRWLAGQPRRRLESTGVGYAPHMRAAFPWVARAVDAGWAARAAAPTIVTESILRHGWASSLALITNVGSNTVDLWLSRASRDIYVRRLGADPLYREPRETRKR